MRFLLAIILCTVSTVSIAADNAARVIKLHGLKGLWLSPESPQWFPNYSSNLFGWWKADSLTNTVNGSEVAFWTDSSGHSLHMRPLATGTGVTPYYTNSFQNGLPALYFDGTNDKLTNACGPSVDSSAFSNLFFIVMQHRIPSAAKATVFDGQRTPTDHEVQEFAIVGSDFSTNKMEDGDSGVATPPLFGPNLGTNVITTHVLQFASVDSKMWTNGVQIAVTGGPLNGFGLLDGMIVGASREGDSFFRGYIMEMFCVTNAFSTDATPGGGTILSDGVNYLRRKWAHY